MLTVYGSVVHKGREYTNEEILELDNGQKYVYGLNWVYGGDQGFQEANIFVRIRGVECTFDGIKGLNHALEYIRDNKE